MDRPTDEKINLTAALASFSDQWAPRKVAAVNDYDVRVVHIEGEFVWHHHDDTDELFLCLDGQVDIHLRDRTVTLTPGELFVVPRGVEHKPVALEPASMLLFEPSGTPNTGSAHDDLPDHIQTTTGIEI